MPNLDFIIKNNLVVGGDATIVGHSLSLSIANISTSDTISISDANSVIDMVLKSQVRSVKYNIQVFSGSDYQVSKILLIHDAYTSAIKEYGILTTSSRLATFSTDISNEGVRLIAKLNASNSSGTLYFSKISLDTVPYEAAAAQPDPGVTDGNVLGDRFGRAYRTRSNETILLRCA